MNPSIWQRLAVPAADLAAALRRLIAPLPAGTPVVVHSDLLRVGIPDGVPDRDAQGRAWLTILLEAVEARPLLIPTFNYDYRTTRRYDPLRDEGQVGALSRHCVAHHAALRTATPMFNFCIFNNDGIPTTPAGNPFGAASSFAVLDQRNAAILFLGVGLIANTFIHYVEESLDIGYRYLKPFPGHVIREDEPIPIDFQFRVRPRVPGAVEYGSLGEELLVANQALTRIPLGHAEALLVRAAEYHRLVGAAMAADELFVLTPAARAITRSLYDRYGRPLTLAALEGAP